MILYILTGIAFFIMGFALTSRGVLFNEKVKTYTSVIAFTLATSAIIYSIMSSFWWGILIIILEFLILPGLGQTLAFLIMRR